MIRVMRYARSYQIGLSLRPCNRFSTNAPKNLRAMKKEQERRKLIYVGVPLLLFMIGGTYFLSVFTNARIEIKDQQQGKGKNSQTIRNFDLEEEHKNLMSKLNLDDFSLSRIPRPEDYNNEKKAVAPASGKPPVRPV